MNNLKSKILIKKTNDGQYETEQGIKIWSRYNHESELKEMLEFCELCNAADLDPYIKDIFYDSNASLCFINTTLDDDIERKDKTEESLMIEKAISFIALITITQYQLFGLIGHQNYIVRKLFFNNTQPHHTNLLGHHADSSHP